MNTVMLFRTLPMVNIRTNACETQSYTNQPESCEARVAGSNSGVTVLRLSS